MNGLDVLRAAVAAELETFLDRRPTDGHCVRHPIVLIPGWGGWSRGLLALERHLRLVCGRKLIRLDLGGGFDCIRRSASRAAEIVKRSASEDGTDGIDVIGYSMGGLVATHLLKCCNDARLVRNVITLGTPHCGSPAVRTAVRLFGGLSESLWQMLPGSEFLADLERRPVPEGSELFSVAGSEDVLVPPRCAELPRAAGHHNLSLIRIDHFGLVLDRASHQLVGNLLRAGPHPICRRAADEQRPAERFLPTELARPPRPGPPGSRARRLGQAEEITSGAS
jgi:pimeloyl-ACP methyl ester carboxylesterase